VQTFVAESATAGVDDFAIDLPLNEWLRRSSAR
jgi:hypothetical protein